MTCETHGIIYVADDTCPACDERERIIKLLQTKPAELMCCTCGMDEVIALIKGEQK